MSKYIKRSNIRLLLHYMDVEIVLKKFNTREKT